MDIATWVPVKDRSFGEFHLGKTKILKLYYSMNAVVIRLKCPMI